MDEVITRLDEMAKALTELKTENTILRKEIVGIGDSVPTNSMGIIENKTLREIVEEIQFEMKASKSITANDRNNTESAVKPPKKVGMNTLLAESEGSDVESTEGSDRSSDDEYYAVVEIRSKSIEEERNWMKAKFHELIEHKTITDGVSLEGAAAVVDSFASIENPFSEQLQSTCTLKLSNFLDHALTEPEYHFWSGSKYSSPSRVAGKASEVISFLGKMNFWECSFMCSFAITRSLRLTIRCLNYHQGDISFGIGFTPANVPTDQTLYNILEKMTPLPDVWIHKQDSKVPLELFVSHGNLLARGHMTPGQRSAINIEILEINEVMGSGSLHSQSEKPKGNANRERGKFKLLSNNPRTYSKEGNYGRFSCNIEIGNCLGVKLNNRSKFNYNCEYNELTNSEVLPSQREIFFAADNVNVEVMFSFEIDSTELAFVVGTKVGPCLNSFAAAFIQLPALTGAEELEALMDPNQWKTHRHRKYARARDGMQMIQMGNLRSEISMTELEQSRLKIRIFCV